MNAVYICNGEYDCLNMKQDGLPYDCKYACEWRKCSNYLICGTQMPFNNTEPAEPWLCEDCKEKLGTNLTLAQEIKICDICFESRDIFVLFPSCNVHFQCVDCFVDNFQYFERESLDEMRPNRDKCPFCRSQFIPIPIHNEN